MKQEYKELYKELIQAYDSRKFEDIFREVLEERFETKEQAKEILSVLCGVESCKNQEDEEFIQAIVSAITEQRVRDKIVQKVKSCDSNCEEIDGKSKCQSVCPFDAIIKNPSTGEKWIDELYCMSCGRCVVACENGNYIDTPQFLPIASLLKEQKKVFAIVAPAIAGQFGEEVTLDQLREAMIQIGFTDMLEVALGADILSLKEALEFDHHIEKKGDFMITSCCCPMWVAALRKVYNKLIPDVSPSVSPMIAMARIIKKLNDDVKVVFIGPCVAKKAEAKEKDLLGDVDAVLTFEELKVIFEAFSIEPGKLAGVPSIDYASTGGRLYARAGGVSQAVWDIVDELFPKKRELFQSLHVDGMKDCKSILEALEKGEVKASFIEGMGCKGGCVGGPKAIVSVEEGTKAVNHIAADSVVKIPIHSQLTKSLLRQLGINELEDLKEGHRMFEREFKA